MADSGSSTDVQKDRVFMLTSLSRCRAFGGPSRSAYDTDRGVVIRKTCQEWRRIQRRDRFTENRPAAYDRSGER